MHTWKCPNGHDNVSEIPDQVTLGPPRRYVIDCRAPGCAGRTLLDVGSAPSPQPQPKVATVERA